MGQPITVGLSITQLEATSHHPSYHEIIERLPQEQNYRQRAYMSLEMELKNFIALDMFDSGSGPIHFGTLNGSIGA